MIFLNKYNLPEHIIRLLPKIYVPKEYRISVTQLTDEPRIRSLMLERWDDIIRDYSELLSTVIGMSVDERTQKLATDDEEVQTKHEDIIDGVTIVGKSDVYVNNQIRDTKVMAVCGLAFEDSVNKFVKQLNCYAYQHLKRDKKVDSLYLDVFYRDWKQSEFLYSNWKQKGIFFEIENKLKTIKGYPVCSYNEVRLPLWSLEEQEGYVKDQIEYHKMGKYTECSDESKWAKPTVYAVMKPGRKSAVVASKDGEQFLTYDEALQAGVKKKLEFPPHYIEERLGEKIRCEQYCPVRNVCKYSQCCIDKWKNEK